MCKTDGRNRDSPNCGDFRGTYGSNYRVTMTSERKQPPAVFSGGGHHPRIFRELPTRTNRAHFLHSEAACARKRLAVSCTGKFHLLTGASSAAHTRWSSGKLQSFLSKRDCSEAIVNFVRTQQCQVTVLFLLGVLQGRRSRERLHHADDQPHVRKIPCLHTQQNRGHQPIGMLNLDV